MSILIRYPICGLKIHGTAVGDLNSIDRIRLAASKALQLTQKGAPQPAGVFQLAVHAFTGVALFHLLKENQTSNRATPAITQRKHN
jgi:hypothetical protein